jgi:chromosome segregation ATPase
LLQQYKSLIREQDQQLSELRRQLEDVQVDHKKLQSQVEEMGHTEQQLRDQNSLLRAQKGSGQVNGSDSDAVTSQLQYDITGLRGQLDKLTGDCADKDATISKLQHELEVVTAQVSSSETGSSGDHVVRPETDVNSSQTEESQGDSSQSSQAQVEALQQELSALKEQLKLKDGQLESAHKQLEGTQQEHEDLLVLLTEQDVKINEYKDRLRQLGEKIADDDDDENWTGEDVEEDS